MRAIEGNRVFDSVSMAVRSYDGISQAIRKAINSGCHAGGVHWEDMKRLDRPKILRPEVPGSVYGKRQKPSARPRRARLVLQALGTTD